VVVAAPVDDVPLVPASANATPPAPNIEMKIAIGNFFIFPPSTNKIRIDHKKEWFRISPKRLIKPESIR
jgi:hypothetical protein